MKNKIQESMKLKLRNENIFKKILGIILVIFGLLALITPLTPGSWLAIIGLELLGVKVLFIREIKKFLRYDSTNK